MWLRLTSLIALLALLIAIPGYGQPPHALPPSGPTVLQLPPQLNLVPPAPNLEEPLDRRRQLLMADLAFRSDVEAMSLILKLDAWLTSPLNEAYRPKTPGQALVIVHAAKRVARYELNGYTAEPLSAQALTILGLSRPQNPIDAVKARMPTSTGKLIDWGVGQAKDKLGQVVERKIPGLKVLGPLQPFVEIADQAFGERFAEQDYQADKALMQILDDAYARTAPADPKRWARPGADSTPLWDATARLLNAGKTDPIVAAVLNDPTPNGLGVVPDAPDDELRKSPRYGSLLAAEDAFKKRTGGPVSAANPFRPARGPASAPLDPRAAALLTRELREHRQALDRNTAAIKELLARQAKTPSEEEGKQGDKDELLKARMETLRQLGHAADLALQCLANLGVDPALVRDLTVVTQAGLKVSAGVVLALANVTNPAGWLSILSGITGLFATGPDPMQLVLEQLTAVRRELADFRYEMRLTLAELRQEVRIGFEQMMMRLNDLEYHLTTQLRDLKDQVEWNEYRLNMIEGQLSALGQQILTRFAELQQRDIVTLLASRDLDSKAFARLSTGTEPSELLKARYHDALSVAYASAVHHSANWSLAKGDFEVPGAYGTTLPHLGEGGPRRLLPVVQDPAAPWGNVNDFFRLARRSGVFVGADPKSATGRAGDTRDALKFPPDRTRLVNPLAWSLAAGAFVDLAADGRKYFTERPEYVRGLVEVYRRGEEFSDAAHQLGTAPNGGVFADLTRTQLAAIDGLEVLLLKNAATILANVGGANPWAGARQPLIDGRYVHWDGPSVGWQRQLNDQGYSLAGATTLRFDEAEALVARGVIPRPFATASRIRPMEGRGGEQALFGGTIRLAVTNVELPTDDAHGHVKHRWSRGESTGFMGWGRGKYHGNSLYEGPVYVTIEAVYRTQAGEYPIFRRRLPTRNLVRFRREDHHDAPPNYWAYDSPQVFQYALDFAQFRRLPMVGRPGDAEALVALHKGQKEGFAPTAAVVAGWDGLREDLAKVPTDWANPGPGMTPATLVEQAVTRRLEYEVFDFAEGTKRAAFHGMKDVGDQIREVVACQGLMLRYVQLALPEYQSDPELLALLIGDQAAWGGTAVIEQFRLAAETGHKPFVIEMHGRKGEYEIPVAAAMRAQTLKLQSRLGELVSRKRAEPTPVRHPAVEAALLRIVFTARALGIDLEKELKAAGVAVPDYWVCRQINKLDPFDPREGR